MFLTLLVTVVVVVVGWGTAHGVEVEVKWCGASMTHFCSKYGDSGARCVGTRCECSDGYGHPVYAGKTAYVCAPQGQTPENNERRELVGVVVDGWEDYYNRTSLNATLSLTLISIRVGKAYYGATGGTALATLPELARLSGLAVDGKEGFEGVRAVRVVLGASDCKTGAEQGLTVRDGKCMPLPAVRDTQIRWCSPDWGCTHFGGENGDCAVYQCESCGSGFAFPTFSGTQGHVCTPDGRTDLPAAGLVLVGWYGVGQHTPWLVEYVSQTLGLVAEEGILWSDATQSPHMDHARWRAVVPFRTSVAGLLKASTLLSTPDAVFELEVRSGLGVVHNLIFVTDGRGNCKAPHAEVAMWVGPMCTPLRCAEGFARTPTGCERESPRTSPEDSSTNATQTLVDDDTGSRLSPGSIVGIVCGSVAAVVLLIGAVFYLRRSPPQSKNTEPSV